MTNIGFHHSSLTVSDLQRSLAFYEGVLGMTKLYEFRKQQGHLAKVVGLPEADVLMAQLAFGGENHRLELFQYLAPDGAKLRRAEPNTVGLTHICFTVNDMQTWHERLRTYGIMFFSDPVRLEDGRNAGGFSVYLRDPDDTIVELLQLPK